MNILILELDPINTELSGVGRTTLSLNKAWLDAGHNVSIIMPRKWPDYLLLRGPLPVAKILEVEQSPQNQNLINLSLMYILRLLQSIKYISKLVHSESLDFIFTNSPVSLVAAYVARTLNFLKYGNKPVIMVPFYHHTPPNAPYLKKYVKYLAPIISIVSFAFINRILKAYFFTESTFTAKMLNKDFKVPLAKILAIGGGVDDEFVKKMGRNNSQKVFDACFIGRIHPSKGIFDLISAWNIIRRRIPEAKLVIIGGGYPHYSEMIEKIIDKSNLRNNVVLCGSVSDEEKFRIMMQSKLLVHPAYEECIPLTFFEAASVNLPIVTYYLPTYEDVVKCLIPVKKGCVEQLADTLVNCISACDTDKEAFYPLIEREKELTRKHTWKNIANLLISETGREHAHPDRAT